MRSGRALLAGLGWAGALGGVALCVLIFLSAYLAFDGDRPDVRGRAPDVVRLPSVPAARVPRVALGRPARRVAGGNAGGRRRSAARGRAAGARRAAPGSRPAPRTVVPGGAPHAPTGTAPRPLAAPPTGGSAPSSGSEGGGGARPGARTLGDTTRQLVEVIGTRVGQVSPLAGQVVARVGDEVGDAVDGLPPVAPRLP